MKKLAKMNFKRVFIIYLIVVIVVGIASAVTLGLVFKDKITLMTDYRKTSNECKNNSLDAKDKLTAFANSSGDVVDVYILDSSGKVLFSAKESGLAENDKLDLQKVSSDSPYKQYDKHHGEWGHERSNTLYDSANPGIHYQVINGKSSHRALLSVVKGFISESKYEDDDEFIENGASRTYALSYKVDRQTGNKTCYIFDFTPVKNAEVYLKIVAAIAGLFFILYWLLVALFVYVSAGKSKMNGKVWGGLALFTNLGGLILYLLYRRINQTCSECNAVQNRKNIHCTSCGAKLITACEKCDGFIGKNEAYCKHCGHKNKS